MAGRSCCKVCHGTKEEALKAAAAVAHARGTNFGQLAAYRCRTCWMQRNGNRQRPWHFGHDPYRVRRCA